MALLDLYLMRAKYPGWRMGMNDAGGRSSEDINTS